MSDTKDGDPTTSIAGSSTLGDRLKKLRELSMRRNEARKLNHEEVVEEDRREKLPANYEIRKRKAEWILEDEKRRSECEARGEDYDRVKALEVQADEAEKQFQTKQRKKNPDTGFADYEQATARQYERLTKQITPNMSDYEKQRQSIGDTIFYPTADTLIVGQHKDSKEAIDGLVADLSKQAEKRAKYHRRRGKNPEGEITYINDRNQKFNEKVERFFGPYTKAIKEDLERGTAI